MTFFPFLKLTCCVINANVLGHGRGGWIWENKHIARSLSSNFNLGWPWHRIAKKLYARENASNQKRYSKLKLIARAQFTRGQGTWHKGIKEQPNKLCNEAESPPYRCYKYYATLLLHQHHSPTSCLIGSRRINTVRRPFNIQTIQFNSNSSYPQLDCHMPIREV